MGEKYHVTHPVAIVAGILRGNPYATITESVSSMNCLTTKNAVLNRLVLTNWADDNYLHKPQYKAAVESDHRVQGRGMSGHNISIDALDSCRIFNSLG